MTTTFEFRTDDLRFGNIERSICNHYDLGAANGSSFMELQPDVSREIQIDAVKGTIICWARVCKSTNSKTPFIVTLSNVRIIKNDCF